MKPPKLYTSRPKRKKPSPRRIREKTIDPVPREEFVYSTLSQRVEEARHLSKTLESYASKMDQWLSALANLSYAMKDKTAFQEVMQALSQLRSETSAKPSPGGKKGSPGSQSGNSSSKLGANIPNPRSLLPKWSPPSKKADPFPPYPKPHSRDGDSLYDLLNAPRFPELVDKVMKYKK
ncbi:hypothetical protein [Salinithrix halophila]|uniref:Uncharacterized protein n=1 Tax=Salinithrix halophila TaxID=1485204 RepID=A0ABV8JGA3_9BACL